MSGRFLHPFVSVLVLVACIGLCSALSSSISPSRTEGLQQRLQQLTAEGGMILLDGDNVRGKTKFQMSKEDLCSNVEAWMERTGLYGQVTLIYDHASKHSAYFLPKSGLSVVFSGPGRTADDVISRDSNWIMKMLEKDVIVVTEDNGLKKRCRTEIKGIASARGKQRKDKKPSKEKKQVVTPAQQVMLEKMEADQLKREGREEAEAVEGESAEGKGIEKKEKVGKDLTFVSSVTFADLMIMIGITDSKGNPKTESASISKATKVEIEATSPPLFYNPLTLVVQGNVHNAELSLLRREVELRKQLSGYQTSLLTCNRKAAVKIRVQIATVTGRLNDCIADALTEKNKYDKVDDKVERIEDVAEVNGESILNLEAISGDKNNTESSMIINSVVDRGSELLKTILSQGRPAGTIEETWERIILAEKMRFTLQTAHGQYCDISTVKDSKSNTSVNVCSGNNSDGAENASTDSSSSSDSIVSIIHNEKTAPSLKYVSYINRSFNMMKRIASVEKQ